MGRITCKCCGLVKDQTDFYKRGKYYNKKCKQCTILYMSQHYQDNKERIAEYKSKYRNINHEAIKLKAREYNSQSEVKIRMIEWRKNNRKSLRKTEKEWRKNNPEKAKEIANRKFKKRRQNPMFRIRYNVSRGIWFALYRNGSSKAGDSIMNHLEFTIDELKTHLESLFEPWMTWNNYGSYKLSKWNDNDPSTWTWQIDHIICQADLPYDSMDHPNFKKCWELSNLRPYSSKQNCLDGANKVRNKR